MKTYTKEFIEKIINDNKTEKVVILLGGVKSNGLASSSSDSIVIHPENSLRDGAGWETLHFDIEGDLISIENKRIEKSHGSLVVKTHFKKYAFLPQVIGISVMIRDF